MKAMNRAADAADRILSIFSGILAVLLLLYSTYVLYDNFYTGQSAFAAWDLLQYKPVIKEENDTVDFEAIQSINPDTVGWVTIYDTHINYPVVQGRDDLEYASKDVFGKSSLTGAIYLSAANSRTFSDHFNIIYGHHMDNGAMFGDIDRYLDKDFFFTHRKGELLTPDGAFELTVFAVLRTDAYESDIYSVTQLANGKLEPIISHIRDNADIFVEKSSGKIDKLVGLSTCANAATNGRIVLFCDAVPKVDKRSDVQAVPAVTERVAKGHAAKGDGGADHWALLNVICVLTALYTVLPLTYIQRKFRQLPYSRRKSKELRHSVFAAGDLPVILEEGSAPQEKVMKKLRRISDDLRQYYCGMLIGILLEAVIGAAAVIILFLTENFFSPMVLSDEYTGLMILIAAFGLLTDFIFYRYRGFVPPENVHG